MIVQFTIVIVASSATYSEVLTGTFGGWKHTDTLIYLSWSETCTCNQWDGWYQLALLLGNNKVYLLYIYGPTPALLYWYSVLSWYYRYRDMFLNYRDRVQISLLPSPNMHYSHIRFCLPKDSYKSAGIKI